MVENKPKFDMNRVAFAWNFSDWGAKFACVMYDVKKGHYIELIKTENNFSLFRVEDIENAFNKIIEKYPTEEKLVRYWQDNFSGFGGNSNGL